MALLWLDVRMLKLNYPPLIGFHICDVFVSAITLVDNLLPTIGKLSFPSSVPFGFVLPPRITSTSSLMGSVPDLDFSALCDHGLIASWTLATKTRLGLLALPIDEGKFHTPISLMAHLCSPVSRRR